MTGGSIRLNPQQHRAMGTRGGGFRLRIRAMGRRGAVTHLSTRLWRSSLGGRAERPRERGAPRLPTRLPPSPTCLFRLSVLPFPDWSRDALSAESSLSRDCWATTDDEQKLALFSH